MPCKNKWIVGEFVKLFDFVPSGAVGLSACGAGAGGVGQEGDCALAIVVRIVARAAPPMARLNVFVVIFILLRSRRNGSKGRT